MQILVIASVFLMFIIALAIFMLVLSIAKFKEYRHRWIIPVMALLTLLLIFISIVCLAMIWGPGSSPVALFVTNLSGSFLAAVGGNVIRKIVLPVLQIALCIVLIALSVKYRKKFKQQWLLPVLILFILLATCCFIFLMMV